MSTEDDEAEDAPEEAETEDAPEDADVETTEGVPDAEEGGDEDAGATLEERLAEVEGALDAEEVGEEALTDALDAAEAAVELAETEADLDEVDAALDDVEAAIEDADLPEPEDEDDDGPREALESRLGEVRDAAAEARGPYAEDAVEAVTEAKGKVEGTRWTEQGEGEVAEAVSAFVEDVEEALDATVEADDDPGRLDAAAEAIEAAGLDPDDDAGTVAALVEAADALSQGIEDAEEWGDLTTREQLEAEGFYDVLDHRKDYPPEWGALKAWEQRGNAEMILLALEKLEADFMEEHCLDALRRMGPEEATDAMLERAGRRDVDGVEILGKIGAEEAVETIVEYVDTEGDPQLQKASLKALGEIGDEAATQAVANQLVADNESVRTHAARALGMLGDSRAIEPLADVLADDESDSVRAAAAWALNAIGTERALEAASEYTDDRSYLVQSEAERAAEAIGAATA